MTKFRIAVFPEQVPEQNEPYLVGVDTESDRQCVQDLFVRRQESVAHFIWEMEKIE